MIQPSAELGANARAENRPNLISLLVLAAWLGLVAGLLEVAAVLVRNRLFDADHILKMSREFVWLTPLVNVLIFVALATVGCAAVLIWPRRGYWSFKRALAALFLLPTFVAGFPHIFALALLFVTLGLASRIVPLIERHRPIFRRLFLVGFPIPIITVAVLAVLPRLHDWSMRAVENARSLPPQGSPNVLLVVLDTVAAEHASVNGYKRATTGTLEELADRGIRFDSARSTSSWTLPSHASMFTGRWFHELSLGWLTPFDSTYPTVAEFLSSRGYATAGFVANTPYCGVNSGIARGFVHYEDFILPRLTAIKTSKLVKTVLDCPEWTITLTRKILQSLGWVSTFSRLWESVVDDRKGAAEVNRELLNWLSNRDQPERPFFAFLNYFDAHYPYRLAPGRLHRFGPAATSVYQKTLIQHWWELDKTTMPQQDIQFAADCYDDCIADLDEQLGRLIDQLEKRGILETTWLIVVADHGESFGEHPKVFCHGTSVYDTEVHVPLLILAPSKKNVTKRVVSEPVSLRDIAATIVDISGQKSGSPFPGESLARFWTGTSGEVKQRTVVTPAVLSEISPNDPKIRDYWGLPKPLPPRAAVKDTEWSYIRREGDVSEELFDLSEDAKETRNLAANPAARATLERLRTTLNRLTDGPLLPNRFKP